MFVSGCKEQLIPQARPSSLPFLFQHSPSPPASVMSLAVSAKGLGGEWATGSSGAGQSLHGECGFPNLGKNLG